VPHVSTARIVVWAALGLLVLSGAAFGLSEGLHRDRHSRTVITDRVSRIIVRVGSGNVDVRAGLTGDVMIDRHDSYLVRRPAVHESFGNGTLLIETSCNGLAGILRCRSDIIIDAPPDVDVVVRTDAGNVDLRGLNGRADVSTGSGDIRTHRLEPVIMRAQTNAGNVSLDLFGQPARTEARSDAGDVRVVVPYGPYRIDARAAAGDVRVEGLIRDDLAPQAIDALAHAGNITVRAR
jgi:hypothetical protein